jgi:hypothetical protein
MHLRRVILAISIAALMSTGPSAQACVVRAPLEISDIKDADAVVIGRIVNYRIVLDQVARENRKKLANDPDTPPAYREFYAQDLGLLSDYAKFDVQVDKVVVGTAPSTLTVTWDNSTFAEPEQMGSGPFLIALTEPRKGLVLPLRAPSATILPSAEPALFTVLQAPCSTAFIFEAASEEARKSL